MEYIPDKYDVALLLWDEGEFLAININIGKDFSSLYRYNDNLYIIWYSKENVLEKIDIVDAGTAKKMFKKFKG